MDTEGIPIREIEPDFYHRMQCGIMYANRGETCSDITIWEVVTRQATTFRVPFRVHELAATTIYGYAFGYKFKRDGEEKQLIIQFELANPGKVCRYVFRRRDLKVKIYGVECTREKVRLSMDVFLKVNSKAIWLAATEKVCYFVGIDRFTIYELCADNSKVFEKVQHGQIIPYRKIKSLVYNEAYGETYTFLRKAYKHILRDSPCPSSPELSFGDTDETSCTKGKDSVKYIACGSNNLTILTHHGIILAYGTNTKEELGLHVEAMHVVELVANAFLTDINTRLETVSLGYFHGAGVGTQSGTDRRLSLTWGLNPYNQLDEEIGEISMSGAVCVMKPPDDGLRIKNVVCEGNQTSYFLSETEDSYKLVAVKVCGDEDHWIL